ncbi:MAG: hypothetical protein HY810_01080 [Candidatus Omnitrophica bacterium]|nr:hypothetical protein [Candidatus Omnitrophota bacterium]
MSKKELAELNNVTPYADKAYKGGWLVSPEFTPIESLLLRAELLQRKRVSHLEISSKLL